MSVATEARASGRAARRLPLLALLGVSAVSTTGNVLTFVAVPWFVLQTTGSAAKTGLAGGAMALAAVVSGLLGGPLVDRFGFKRSSIAADVGSAVPVALIPLLHHGPGLSFWQLVALVFLGSLVDSPGVTARESLIPDLARVAGTPVERANAAYQATQRASMLLGAPLAGVLTAFFGASNVLLLDAATFAGSAAVIALAVPARLGTRERPVVAPRPGYLVDLAEGLRFIRRDRTIRALVIAAVIANLLLDPVSTVISPVLSDQVYGSVAGLGVMLAGFGGGAVAGAALFGLAGHRLPRRGTFVGALAAAGPPLWVLATVPPLPVAVGALFAAGVAIGPVNPLLYTILQERCPTALRGRVLGAFVALAMAAVPAGAVLSGYAVELFGLRPTLMGISACYSALILGLWWVPAFREMTDHTGARASPSHPPSSSAHREPATQVNEATFRTGG